MKIEIFLVALFFFTTLLTYGQDTIIRIGPSLPSIDNSLKPIFIYDGIPLYSDNQLDLIDSPDIIDSIYIYKDTIFNCKNKPEYYGIVEIYSIDSINLGLKYILNQTNFWIFNNPLAEIEINRRKKSWNRNLAKQLMEMKPEDILKIEIVDSVYSVGCSNGLIRLTIRK